MAKACRLHLALSWCARPLLLQPLAVAQQDSMCLAQGRSPVEGDLVITKHHVQSHHQALQWLAVTYQRLD